jgi:hypothetical protein
MKFKDQITNFIKEKILDSELFRHSFDPALAGEFEIWI